MARSRPRSPAPSVRSVRFGLMGYWLGGGAIYLVLIFTLGVLTIRKGHWVMFIVGIFVPLFWLIGALMRPVPRR